MHFAVGGVVCYGASFAGEGAMIRHTAGACAEADGAPGLYG